MPPIQAALVPLALAHFSMYSRIRSFGIVRSEWPKSSKTGHNLACKIGGYEVVVGVGSTRLYF
jgi:hypothetical protein